MRVIGPKNLGQTLTEWALHEGRGRGRGAEALDALPPSQGRFHAACFLLENRRNVVAAILAAEPLDSLIIEVRPEDVPRINTMGALPLERFSANMLAAHDADGSGDWVRQLVAGGDVVGPFVAVARRPEGPLTLFDGLHRAAAWVGHANAGRRYPILVDVVITARAAPYFELAP